jgi:ATP-binding cassette, subfamily B, bacterial
VLVPGSDDKATRRAAVLGRTFSFSRRHWLPITGVLLLDLLAIPLTLLTPLALKVAIDSVIGSEPLPGFVDAALPGILTSSDTALLFAVALIQVLVVLGTQLQEMSRYVLGTYTGEKLTLAVRSSLFRHMQRLSLLFHDRRGTTDSVYRVQYDAPSFQYIVVDACSLFFSSAAMLIAMIVVIARIDWQLATIALAVCPLLWLASRRFSDRVLPRYRSLKGIESDAMKVVQEVLSGLRIVKAFNRETSEHNRFVEHSTATLRARTRLSLAEGLFGLVINVLMAIGTAAVLFVGVRNINAGLLTLGEFTVVIAYLAQLYSPLKMISTTAGAIQSSLAGVERVFEVLDYTPEVQEKPDAIALSRTRGEIVLEDVSFTYEREIQVLNNVSLTIPSGTVAGISGPTGAGKSTLVGLIARFYDPTAGRVLLDGIDLRDYKLDDLRNQFGFVLQEPMLFTTTIAQNIAFGRADATHEEIVEAAIAANAHDFISALPDGYETVVGERGMTLSGGERQRISLARAFIKDAPILILDEPTSSVDIETEAQIVEALSRLVAGRTTLMIAHRLSTLENCDMFIQLRDGDVSIDLARSLRSETKAPARALTPAARRSAVARSRAAAASRTAT